MHVFKVILKQSWKEVKEQPLQDLPPGGHWPSGGNTEPRPVSLERAELGRPEDRGSERLAGLDCVGPSWQAGVLGSRPGGGVKGAGHFLARDEDVWKEQEEAGQKQRSSCRADPPTAPAIPPDSLGPLDLGTVPGCGRPGSLWFREVTVG